MDYFKINGRAYDVFVLDLEESFTILYSGNTGRTMAEKATMVLDPIGTFYGHTVTVAKKQGKEEEYDELWDFLSKPRDKGVPVEVAHNQSTIAYDAYVSNGTRKLKRITKTDMVDWGEMSINIVPMEAYEVME